MTNTKTRELLESFCRACRPPDRLPPAQWANGRVALCEGKSSFYDTSATPWMVEPLNEFANPSTQELLILSPTGSGKTTMMEVAMAYIIAEDPGPTLVVGQTDSTIEEWFETRLDHTLKNTKDTADLLPSGKSRHKKRKDAIIFPHMALYATGAKESGLQYRSMRRVICDEVWTFNKGMVRQAEARLHDRHNRQFVLVSQGGSKGVAEPKKKSDSKGDDWYKKWRECNQYERMWHCPDCKTAQPFTWDSVKYDEVQGDKLATAQTARIKCVNADCEFTIADDPQIRRELSQSAKYYKTKDGIPNTKGFHFTIVENWNVPLWRLVLQRIDAMEEASRGNLEPLKQFIQKRLADFWEEENEDNRVTLTGGGYSVKDYANGEKWEDEHVRFMTIDRQQDHFWVEIRAWAIDGNSRLLWFGKVDTWDRVKVIQETYGVENRKTQIDCGHQKDEVYKRCAQYGWLALRGDQRDSYPHKSPSGKTIYKAYSRYQTVSASDGRKTMVAFFSNLAIKDILHQLRNGKGVAWEIPDDVGNDYLQQIDAEVRRGEGRSAIWKPRRRDNHAVDTGAMQIVLASCLGLIGTPDDEEKE